ncbi:MAG: hypothetical protein HWD62_13765 [Cyclobacteriaceae bacterium]|nr:MAG: hypothetical protein HWD62_13765 [Cyclobacteriaceae bacterium]
MPRMFVQGTGGIGQHSINLCLAILSTELKNEIMKYVFILVLTTCNGIVWAQSDLLELPIPKRFIDKIEVFAGLNLSLNYGNMFIENYRGVYANNNYVVNKRLLKSGYSFGVGAHHSFANSIALNVSVQFEQKELGMN